MSITTRRGDRGTTTLYGESRRRRKDAQRIVAIGDVDELNSHLGLVASLLPRRDRKIKNLVLEVQKTLFEIGAELATPPRRKPLFSIDTKKVRELERLLDDLEGSLFWPGLFILPGGHPAAAEAHVARSVCRRAERELVRLSRQEKVNPQVLKYINRLSDFLFVVARTINKKAKIKETTWAGKRG